MATSRACCAELDEKQPKAQGMETNAASTRLVPIGQISRLSAIAAMPAITEREAPMRSMFRDITMVPMKPNTPNHMSKRLSSPGVIAILSL
jgi:hypothetical protein